MGKARRSERRAAVERQRSVSRRVAYAAWSLVLVVAVGIVAGAAVVSREADTAGSLAVDPEAKAPESAVPAGEPLAFGVPYRDVDETIPTLEVWEDFQCPACGMLEARAGHVFAKAADDRLINLVWRPTAFLDPKIGNDSSSRAVNAWGCAIDSGRGPEFHGVVFANQPAREGDGWTDEELVGFGSQAGIPAGRLPAFASCVADGTYLGWAANATVQFTSSGITRTPTVRLNGQDVPFDVLGDEQAFRAYVAANPLPSPSPSPSGSASPSPSGSASPSPSGSASPSPSGSASPSPSGSASPSAR